MSELDAKTKALLNALQAGLPLVERPYRALGDAVGLNEDEVMERVRSLKADGVLRQVSAIFDTRALGYDSCLVACKVAPERLDAAAEIISRHPGVSHNYARNHAYNLWFTLAVPPGASLEAHLAALQKECGAEAMRPLPALRVFKIGVKLDMADEEVPGGNVAGSSRPQSEKAESGKQKAADISPLSERDIRCLRALQKDMPAQGDAFAPIAEDAGMIVPELLAWCAAAVRLGRMRRVAGVLRHRAAGFHANGMGAWNVPADRVEEIGALFAAQKTVTHCYQRPSYPDWPYNIFTMVHARTTEACEEIIAGLARDSGIWEHAVLYSHKEYKKTRLLYFTGEIEAWEKAHGVSGKTQGAQ